LKEIKKETKKRQLKNEDKMETAEVFRRTRKIMEVKAVKGIMKGMVYEEGVCNRK
jgi:hypothetical protein